MKTSYKLRSKLLFLAGLAVATALLVAAIGWFGLRSMNAAETALAEDAVPSMVLIAKINDTMSTMREKSLLALIASGDTERAAARRVVAASREALPKLLDDYKTRVDSDDERKLFERMADGCRAFVARIDTQLREAEGADAAKLDALRQAAAGDTSRQFDAIGETIDALTEFNAKAVAESHDEARQASRSAAVKLGAALVIASLLLVAFAVGLTRSVMRQIGGEPDYASAIVREIAAGNLAVAVQTVPGDDSSLLAAMSGMRENLARLVGQVRASSDSIATGSNEIASGNADLSRRTEQQASSLQQTAASMEQLTATVTTNAETARQATQLAGGARDVALQGGVVVEQVVQTMASISASSGRIADIIGVIDGIAFQTNILALNAAVEAARAGEQGRGFAVVASEVRSLAQRSAQAAREIKQLITDSVEKVEAGRMQVGEAGRTMSNIVDQVKRVSDLIGEIDTATREQAQGIGEVGGAVTQLDQATQQNAALVEQSAAAADSLNQQANRLVDAVSLFKLAAAAH